MVPDWLASLARNVFPTRRLRPATRPPQSRGRVGLEALETRELLAAVVLDVPATVPALVYRMSSVAMAGGPVAPVPYALPASGGEQAGIARLFAAVQQPLPWTSDFISPAPNASGPGFNYDTGSANDVQVGTPVVSPGEPAPAQAGPVGPTPTPAAPPSAVALVAWRLEVAAPAPAPSGAAAVVMPSTVSGAAAVVTPSTVSGAEPVTTPDAATASPASPAVRTTTALPDGASVAQVPVQPTTAPVVTAVVTPAIPAPAAANPVSPGQPGPARSPFSTPAALTAGSDHDSLRPFHGGATDQPAAPTAPRPVLAGVSDGVLLQRYAGGEQAAFTELVRRHGRAVNTVCTRVLGDPEQARDASQATFLALARRASALDARDSLAGWLYRVAGRMALRVRATATRQRRLERVAAERSPQHADDAVADIETADAHQAVREELQRLPEKYRAPLVLSYLDGRTHAEVARAVGLPLGSVAKRIGEGLDRLREGLAVRGFLS